jgi:hypothetical protein
MSPRPNLPRRTSAAQSAVSRDAGLLRIRTATKGFTAAAALGSVALGLVFAQTSPSQAASSTTATVSGQATQHDLNAPTTSSPSDAQPQLAPPPQPPAEVAPQVQPQAVSGGS